MAAVQAFVDLRNFGHLPRAGGAFDQPAWLMEELRHVHAVVVGAEAARRKRKRRR